MTPLQARLAWGGFLGFSLCLSGLLLTTGNAQPEKKVAVTSLMPQEAIVYVSWDGNDAHNKAWEETAAYEALHESGLMDVFYKTITWAGEQAQAQNKEVEFKDFKKIWKTIYGQGISMAVWIEPGPDGPEPKSVLVLHNGAELEATFSKYLKNEQARLNLKTDEMQGRQVTHTTIPEIPNGEFGWWKEGQHLVISFGVRALEPALAVASGKAGNITNNKLYAKYAKTDDFEMNAVAWVDFGSLRKMFGGMPIPAPQNGRQGLFVNDILEVAGLDKVGAMVVQSGYKGKSVWSQTTLEAPGERTGLLSLLEQKPLNWDELPPLPAQTSGFSVSSVNWSKFYEDMIKTARKAAEMSGPDERRQLEDALTQVPEFLGFDPRKGLFDSLGTTTCIFGDDAQGMFGMSFGMAVQVKDEKRLNATLKLLLAKAAVEAPPEQFMVRTTTKHGKDIISLELAGGLFCPSYVISEGWLVIGLVPQVPEAFVLRQQKKLPSWEPNETIKAALKELPENFTSITVSDPKKIYQLMMGLAPYAVGGARMMAQQELHTGPDNDFPIAVADLPPTELVTRPLYDNITISVADKDHIRWISRNSVPSIPLLGDVSSATTIPVLVALLLPAVQQARMAARRAQSKNNMKQLGLAMHNYADTFGEFPAGAKKNDDLKLEQRWSWLAQLLPYIDQAPLYDQIDFKKGWDDEANQRISQANLEVLINPQHSLTRGKYGQTHYIGVAGLGEKGPTLPVNNPKAGVFGYNRTVKFRDIRDGTSNTIMVGEASEKGVGDWAAGTQTIHPFVKKPYINGPDGFGSPFPGGAHFLFADGSVRFISENIDPKTMEALITINGGEVVGGDF